MQPYYDHAGITIYHGDCRELLPMSVAAVVTDPPYGIQDKAFTGPDRVGKRTGASNTWHPESDWDADIDPAYAEVCCAAASVVAWFGHWKQRHLVAEMVRWPLRTEIVWAKDCHVGPPCPVARRDERIWVFAENGIKPQTFETSVWDHPIIPTWEKKWHKNEKPVGLMGRLLRFLCTDEATILDPFMGSGSTLVAARALNRRAIGIEIEEKYCEIAAERLAQEVLQL